MFASLYASPWQFPWGILLLQIPILAWVVARARARARVLAGSEAASPDWLVVAAVSGQLCIIADNLIKRKVFRLVTVRRIFNTISQVIPAILLAFVTLDACELGVAWATAVISVAMFVNGGFSSGHFASAIDLAPNFAGSHFLFRNFCDFTEKILIKFKIFFRHINGH